MAGKDIARQAVIFDMDGVIVDSMPYHFLAWYETLRPYGIRISCFDVYAKEGEKWETSIRYFAKRAGIKPTVSLLRRMLKAKQAIFKRYFKRHIFEDAEKIISGLKKIGTPIALVSGSSDNQIKKILPRNIHDSFDCIVAGNHVRRGKPHPEPYLRAAKILGVKPLECVVVENAPYGIESAKRAGMYCVAVSTSLPKEFLSKADLVVEKLSDYFGKMG